MFIALRKVNMMKSHNLATMEPKLEDIPIFFARKEHFSEKDGFKRLIKEIRELGMDTCGVVLVKPPEELARLAKNHALSKVEEKLKFSKAMKQKPVEIGTGIYDSVRNVDENPEHEETFTWNTWKESKHGQIRTKEQFWKFFKKLAKDSVDIVYPNGVNISFTGEGNEILVF